MKTLHWNRTWSYDPQNTSESRRNQRERPETLENRLSDTKCFENHCCRHQTREAGGRGGPSAAGDAGGGVSLSNVPPRAHTHALPVRGEQDRSLWWRVWLTCAPSGHRTRWSGSPAADSPSCMGGFAPHSLEVRVSKHQPRQPTMYCEMS